jgi:tyrosine-protein phosphatase YwqE
MPLIPHPELTQIFTSSKYSFNDIVMNSFFVTVATTSMQEVGLMSMKKASKPVPPFP